MSFVFRVAYMLIFVITWPFCWIAGVFGYQSRGELRTLLELAEEKNEILQEALADAESHNQYLRRQLEGRQTAEQLHEP